ncbi:MAG: hypothetical protein ABI333_04120 [bacterium]
MTALTQAASTADELLQSAAREIESFLAEIRRLNTQDDAWRTLIDEQCHALNERLAKLHRRLENQVQGAHTAIAELRGALTAYREEIRNGAGIPSLHDLQVAVGQRYDVVVETLRARRITAPLELASELEGNRSPKLTRAIFHVLMGVACAGLYQFVVTKSTALLLLAAFVVFFGAVELLRRFSKPINDFWTDRVFGAVGRPQERYRINSASYYMWGMAVVTIVAPKTIACAALLVLAFGDPIASAVGYRVNLLRFRNGKSLGGTLSFVLASGLVVALYLGLYGGMSAAGWMGLAAVMALAGAAAELLSGKLDDNLVIPIACAAAGMLFTYTIA